MRSWSLNGLRHPSAVHIAVTLRHTQPGMAATFPACGAVNELMTRYIDRIYEINED